MTQLSINARYSSYMIEHDVNGKYVLTEYWYIEPHVPGSQKPIVIRHEYHALETLLNKIKQLDSLEFKQEREVQPNDKDD